MFRKLVSNLPFSPSLINQLGFYSRRLRGEKATRKIGLIFTALALVVQTITIIAPAQSTLAASANDIVYGGNGKTHSGVISAYVNNRDSLGRRDIRKIFNHYDINETNLRNAKRVTIKSTVANNYWSTGRAPRGHGGEVAVQVSGGPRIYSRTLHGWAANRNWQALEIKTSKGTRWILLECGNIVTQTVTKPKKPDMKVTKTVNKATANKGDKVTFTIKATNIGDGTAQNVLIYDDAPVGLDLLNDGLATDPIKSPRRWEASRRFNIAPGQTYTYRINAKVTKWGPVSLTNKACVDFFDINIYNNCGTVKITVPQGCPLPGKDNLPKNHANCKTNPGLSIAKVSSQKNLKVGDEFDYKLSVKNTGDTSLTKVVVVDKAPSELEFIRAKEPRATNFRNLTNKREYTSGTFALSKGASVEITIRAKVISASDKSVKNTACVLGGSGDASAGACDDDDITIKEVCPTNPNLAQDDPSCQPPCPIEGKEHLQQNSPECRPCDESRQDDEGKDISCLIFSKRARNVTQDISNANGTTAKAGDTIEYTLSVTNTSKETRTGFVVEENLEDVLEYADILDNSGATFTDDPVKMLTWDPVNIRPNETITRTVTIKIKSPIPATPASTSDPYSYDLKITNMYGNTVQINLPPHPIKTIERTVTQLPNTGLGANVIIGALLLGGATYFYYRSRLLIKEVGLVRQQFNYGAGA